jgi:hypothetical protein
MEGTKYQELCDKYKLYGCELITTKQEIDELLENSNKSVYYQKLHFMSKCGHESDGYLINLIGKGTGVNCRKCARAIMTQKQKENRKEGKQSGLELEYEGFKYIREIINKDFEVVKTNEGCIADFIVRPIGSNEDEWLMIQLKTTRKPSFGLYCFRTHGNDYSNCVMVMICLDDKKTWILDGKLTVGLKTNLNIGIGNSKYNEFMVNNNSIDILNKFYESKDLFEREVCIYPQSPCQQQEQDYRRIIGNELSFLNYTYPEEEGLKHDFLINDKKVQEKVCSITTKKNGNKFYLAALYNNNGKIDGIRQFKSYKKGENDFYWIWIKGERCFYVIPEKPLLDNGKIDDGSSDNPINRVYLGLKWKSDTEWYSEYKFDLDNLNAEKLKEIFE